MTFQQQPANIETTRKDMAETGLGLFHPGLSQQARAALREAIDGEGLDETEPVQINVTTHISRKKASVAAAFVVAFTDNLNTMLENGISPREMRAIGAIMKAMEYGNLIEFSQRRLATELKVTASAVSKIFKSLREKKILINRDGHTYLNSTIAAKGLGNRMTPNRKMHLKAAQDTAGGKFTKTL